MSLIMRKIFLFVLFTVVVCKAFATVQVRDLIVIEGDTLELYSLPWENTCMRIK